ncbi:TniB family NTP-binding protein [Streptomyces sp. 5-10]|uniref:TniB family NTP-binding protein n=1 Tax=Streptomyces sp. 5-10 TaxID=878925 RepID=UPI00168AE1B9|nr:TniB family NTP-binding protein [Streptomyces sp. 5-10]MBD3008244.1 ATP-binding protein [Streptomyces sp. 5-10]
MVTATGPAPGQQPDPGRQHGWRRALGQEELHCYLTTLEGWREFAVRDPAPPDLLPDRVLDGLDPDERLDYEDGRIDYHTRLTVAETSTLRTVVHTGRRLTLLNRHAISARRGLILSGPAGTGKTTALTQFGKTIEAIDRRRHPGVDGRIPVVYVTVPPAATSRMLAVEFARFLGLPVTTRANITDVIEAVCGVLIDARVTVVCVDELHNLSLATRNGAEVSDTLKYFSERIPATFVYAGVDLEANGLFDGTRGRQIAGRFGVIETVPFPRTEEWAGLVTTLEQALRLHHHRSGTLEGPARYLHERTGGMIGSLSHLIRGAAIDAILNGTEKITRKSLQSVKLDRAAQNRRARPAS